MGYPLKKAMLGQYWGETENKVDWMDIECELCKPFNPIEALSQSPCLTSNPVLLHSRDVWIRMHKMLKLTRDLQGYSPGAMGVNQVFFLLFLVA